MESVQQKQKAASSSCNAWLWAVIVILVLVLILFLILIGYGLYLVSTSVFSRASTMTTSPCAYIAPPKALAEPTWGGPPRQEFDPQQAYYMADIIQRMYASSCSTNPASAPLPLLPPSWRLLGMIQAMSDGKQEPFGMLIQNRSDPSIAMLAIRGSVTTQDWMVDQDWSQINITNYFLTPTSLSTVQNKINNNDDLPMMVHNGFWVTYQSMAQQLYQLLDANTSIKTLYITGHSLGAALAWLAAADLWKRYGSGLSIRLYPIATPRFGNPMFIQYLNQSTSNGIQERFQLLNNSDLVPTLPLAVTPRTFDPSHPWLYEQPREFVMVDRNLGSYSLNHQLSTYQTILLDLINNDQ